MIKLSQVKSGIQITSMPSKPGRPATKGSFKKGNQAALGNDKTLRLSTWLDKVLDQPVGDISTLSGYEAAMQAREVLVRKFVKTAVETEDPATFKAYFDTAADRTEGKPKQQTDVTSNGETVQVSVFVPEKYE